MKVLVVEDEKRIAAFVRKGLQEAGLSVEVLHDGDEAHAWLKTETCDVVVLDIMLPGRDGLSILRQLRAAKNTVPVVLLTARSALDERIEGLNLGADDYLAKPFHMEELIARVHAVSRRSSGERLSILNVGGLSVNLITREVKRGDTPIRLTAREFALFEYLLRSPGRVLTRTQILEHVWGYDFDPSTNLVDVHIQRLRKKLGGGSPDALIETVRGVGYRLRKEEA
jgi:two-component system, OmpR family, response regulator